MPVGTTSSSTHSSRGASNASRRSFNQPGGDPHHPPLVL